jgi:AcrR family transcriptional regulator
MDQHAEFDARDGEHFSSNINASSESEGQQRAAKTPPRTRILFTAAELRLRHGIAGVSVEAIAKAAATAKPTVYNHFASKDELVAEYLDESAKRLDVRWAEIGPLGSGSALVRLGAWLAEMAGGLVDGWACRFINATVELQQKSNPARRVIKTHNALRRRRLARLCRAAGVRNPSMLADALLLPFDGACVMAPSVGRIGLSSRFLLLSQAMIAAHAKAQGGDRHLRFALRVEAGMTHANDQSLVDTPTGPFGGEKNSGLGRFGGEWILHEFTRDHWVAARHSNGSYLF